MKKMTLRKNLALAAMMFIGQSAGAQEIPSLKSSDYTKPTWTMLNRLLSTMQPSTMPYSINMTVNGDPATRMAFAWFTNPDVITGEVQIVDKANATADDVTSPTITIRANTTDVKGLNYSIAKNKLDGIE